MCVIYIYVCPEILCMDDMKRVLAGAVMIVMFGGSI